MQHLDLLKDIPQEASPALAAGDALHRAFQRRVELNLPMPTAYTMLTDWGNELVKEYHPDQATLLEKQFALSEQLEPCHYFSKRAWYRCKIDHLKLIPWKDTGKYVAIVIDFKTGKPKEDDDQLALYALTVFKHYSKVESVRTEYWWTMTKDKDICTYTRKSASEAWDQIFPKVLELKRSIEDNNFPPKKSGLCKEWCPVLSCEFNGRPK